MNTLNTLIALFQADPAALLIAAGAVIVSAYLIGSVCFAVPVCRLFFHGDVYNTGSQDAGAANVLSSFGFGAALLTFIGDVGKGAGAVALGQYLFETLCGGAAVYGGWLAALFVVFGHVLPVFFRFRGGKGLLPAFGALLIADPSAALLTGVVFIAVCLLTHYASAASVCAAAAMPVIVGVLWSSRNHPDWIAVTAASVLMALMILLRHRVNLRRLLTGAEKPISVKRRLP